ncbi:hypothetical protein K0M31_006497 [Melipona bicolor]|uniref:Uncharacterized protein n=1 Tax=Melipona bicolor TaxID=60889 RepID=A0AA40KLV3_9HYME|nr:hypothetical protein K0M31_006497 [Melipona bicolor]
MEGNLDESRAWLASFAATGENFATSRGSCHESSRAGPPNANYIDFRQIVKTYSEDKTTLIPQSFSGESPQLSVRPCSVRVSTTRRSKEKDETVSLGAVATRYAQRVSSFVPSVQRRLVRIHYLRSHFAVHPAVRRLSTVTRTSKQDEVDGRLAFLLAREVDLSMGDATDGERQTGSFLRKRDRERERERADRVTKRRNPAATLFDFQLEKPC